MLLGSSISNTTKKFFQRTLENYKSCFSPGYQKLPKTPQHNQFSSSVAAPCVLDDMDINNNPSYKELEKFYSDFTGQWDSVKEKGRPRRSKNKGQEVRNESFVSLNNARSHDQIEKSEECDKNKNNIGLTHHSEKQKLNYMKDRKGNGNRMVEKKLRELEMLDMSDVDYVLDIEEVLHYYSRLTCPVYLQIVDKFFMEMCSEFFGAPLRPVVTPRTPSIKVRS
ncbi:hypothetical protein JHK82_020389 [Glycine max]|uniref:OVATE domain-containing protein n=2 Tax=Glycine subgen. Soja TaxID=1462606 RepID=I1KQ19_SOYBN|nr:uncharacterized protein LOC100811016 [Glycine max]XP_028246908.1 uncharacterized protein LOC114424270 [Glycine soja]KAG4999215.1 hypothetical protein JHK87_020287 [Glycine soja]KAG5024490.1 hypothetical protein JHK86_020404 [Glycine max]KAG5135658.1 hypothetical protein JHK82_020389 [Glycine max]KAH1049515.1 hypothetical protein GYH30_020166 [Glycine max]KHN16604.1 hypothetical protein glysoja_002701 [Glycine soja]|eukprot:XP_003532485.1 uncharacterized protein LOC100811016 [Glycine max]